MKFFPRDKLAYSETQADKNMKLFRAKQKEVTHFLKGICFAGANMQYKSVHKKYETHRIFSKEILTKTVKSSKKCDYCQFLGKQATFCAD